ncbi:MAG: hypothetical protein IJ790_00870 [Lachnospiraceae bacterium]|nr:hypothetical protein [Lachnospiraceae bacterium]
MKVVVNKSFATRLRGYNAGEITDVSEAEFKDFANLVSPVNSETKTKNETDSKAEKSKKKKE